MFRLGIRHRHQRCALAKSTARKRIFSSSLPPAKALLADPVVWEEISTKAGQDVLEGYTVRANESPNSVPFATIPTEEVPNSDKRVILYRDTNGWCPFCQRVWMMLIEKDIDFDTMLINLRDKPAWYPKVASNNMTPAARIDGEYICESLDIMAVLEEKFPEPSLQPKDTSEAEEFMERFSQISRVLFQVAFGSMPDPEPLLELQRFLEYADQAAAKHEGQYLFGEFSTVDMATAPFLPSLLHVRQGLDPHAYPHLVQAIEALQTRASYQQTAIDHATREMMAAGLFKMAPPAVDLSSVPDSEMAARRQAAAKVAQNRDALINVVMHGSGNIKPSGVVQVLGGVPVQQDDGLAENQCDADVAASVEHALQRLCMYLLTGDTGTSPEDKGAVAIQVVTFAFLRNLVSSPRDMTADAAQQFRLACDAVARQAYVFP